MFDGRRIDAGLVAAPVEPSIGRGVSVGRYVIIERIGRGGMGEVFAAHDPKLDRPVAIKVVHPAGPTRRPR